MKFDTQELEQFMQRTLARADLETKAIADQSCPRIETYGRTNRRWEDRTHEAKKRLKATVKPIGTGYRIEFAHGVDYGIYLEMKYNKKYAILQESVDYVAQSYTMPKFNRFLERFNKGL